MAISVARYGVDVKGIGQSDLISYFSKLNEAGGEPKTDGKSSRERSSWRLPKVGTIATQTSSYWE